MTVDPRPNHAESGSDSPDASLVQASVVIDVLLDARLDAGRSWRRERIDDLLRSLTGRRMLTPAEAIETIGALDAIDAIDAVDTVPRRRSRRPGHR